LERKTVGYKPSSVFESLESQPIISVDNNSISLISHKDIHNATLQLFSIVGNCIGTIHNAELIAGIPYQLPLSNALPLGVYCISVKDPNSYVFTSTIFIH